MAAAVANRVPVLNLTRISSSVYNSKKQISLTNQTILTRTKSIQENVTVQKRLISENQTYIKRREEQDERNKQEAALEAPDIVKNQPGRISELIAPSNQGIFGRLLGFAGYLAAGWILTRLPQLIKIGEEFLVRLKTARDIIGNFFSSTLAVFQTLGNALTGVASKIAVLDFDGAYNGINQDFDTLLTNVGKMGVALEEAFSFIIDPLGTRLSERKKTQEQLQQGKGVFEEEQPGGGAPSSGGGGRWKPLLDLIASVESSTDKQNNGYDAQNGAPRGVRPGLSQMTIGEIARTAPGASGRYQQLPQYLLGRARAAGYNENTVFSPQVQDVLAIKLIEGRGGNAWLAGKMSTEQFMQGLANEWAALPNAYGQFSYSGQGSSLRAEKVKSVLNQVKQTPEQPAVGPIPNQSALPPLPPTDTLSGGVQRYGASREGGKRKHAGVDFDISGNQKFYSRIGGVVVSGPFRYGADGWGIDIYNKQLRVYERIAEAAKVLVSPGDIVKPGQAVVQGESGTGVIHYEIRKKQSGGFENSVDPIAFLRNAPSAQIASQPQGDIISSRITPERQGEEYLVLDQRTPQQPMMQQSSYGSGGVFIGGEDLFSAFNSNIKKRLLNDLSFV